MSILQFFVPGIPAPQGSKRYLGNGIMVEASAKTLKPWRNDIARIARSAAVVDEWSVPGAVHAEIVFFLARPKTVSVKKRPRPSVKPDLDKLIRAVFDSLTIARVIADDATVVSLNAEKMYALGSDELGVSVRLSEAAGLI